MNDLMLDGNATPRPRSGPEHHSFPAVPKTGPLTTARAVQNTINECDVGQPRAWAVV